MKKAVQVVIINFLIIFLLCGCVKMQALVDIKDNLNFKVYLQYKTAIQRHCAYVWKHIPEPDSHI